MKKKLLAVFAAVAVAGSTLAAFAACANNNAQGGMGGAGTAVQQRARDAYGIGAVTTAKLLSDISPVAIVKSASAVLSDGGDGKQVAEFDKYFQTLDTFLNEDAIKTNVEDNFDEAYPYDYKLTVNGSDLDGTGVTYTMYYSEQVLTVESEYDDDDPDEAETLEAYSLEGVMVLEGVAYNMTGYRAVETETERGESEVSEELWMRATHPDDKGTYVQMDIESENESERGESEREQEYVYSIYRGGRLLERTLVDFETESEHGKEETEYELSITRDGQTSRYEVERAVRGNGSVTIGVKYYNINGKSGRLEITQTAEGKYVYDMDDGERYEFDDRFDD